MQHLIRRPGPQWVIRAVRPAPDHTGGQAPAAASREIDDDPNAAEWLERVFDAAVGVKPRFRSGSGRRFRNALRAAGR
jgi:hypothetical protein